MCLLELCNLAFGMLVSLDVYSVLDKLKFVDPGPAWFW
jgi:hypothetical protein